MKNASLLPHTFRFGVFELNPSAKELRKQGMRIRLQGQPVEILTMLLERPGELITREELQKKLWPADTFVDFEQGLNNAMKRLRTALDDDAQTPRFIETLPRRGYRFVAPVEHLGGAARDKENPIAVPRPARKKTAVVLILASSTFVLLGGAGWLAYQKWRTQVPKPVQRSLTRLTFDEGLQAGPTWSPDGRFIAYSSDRGGKFDIWVQQVSGGDPLQITKGPGTNWQPDWSPDGKYIAYRSESDGGIYIMPALGGAGQQRKIVSFGYFPRWSPDSTRILFQTSRLIPFRDASLASSNKVYVTALDGSPPRLVLSGSMTRTPAFCAWHPDGRRITAWIPTDDPVAPRFVTQPVEGGPAIESKLTPELAKQLKVVESPEFPEWRLDFRFAWAPSGRAIYFERTVLGARNIWRMTVDPATLQPRAVERLTTSPALDEEFSVSPDGRRLAFTNVSAQVRAWMFPFYAGNGRITGQGRPVTSARIETYQVDVTRDGQRLGIAGRQGGLFKAWEVAIQNGREEIIMPADSYLRNLPIRSPDGKRAAYMRGSADRWQIAVWSRENRNEEPVGPWSSSYGPVYDWSPDGSSVVLSQRNDRTGRAEVWQVPVGNSGPVQFTPRKIISHPNDDVYQPHFSRDGRWIVFVTPRALPQRVTCTLFVVPVSGGPWVPITDGKQWDDKPRWSPDGKVIYFLSDRRGLFNVWGIRFNPASGRPLGEPFHVTSFDSPTLKVSRGTPIAEFSLTEDRLLLPLEQSSGGIWVLDNVDQ